VETAAREQGEEGAAEFSIEGHETQAEEAEDEGRDKESEVEMTGEGEQEEEQEMEATGVRVSGEEWYEAEETTSLARSSSLSSFFDTQPEGGMEEMGAGAQELPALRRSFSTDDALTLLAASSKPAASSSQVTKRRYKNGGRPVRRQPQPLTHLSREEQRLLLVLHLMLLLPPEYDGSKPQKPQQGRGNGAAKGNKLPRQESKGARQHEARAQSQLSGAHRRGCKNN